jgi:hypothetical protein
VTDDESFEFSCEIRNVGFRIEFDSKRRLKFERNDIIMKIYRGVTEGEGHFHSIPIKVLANVSFVDERIERGQWLVLANLRDFQVETMQNGQSITAIAQNSRNIESLY